MNRIQRFKQILENLLFVWLGLTCILAIGGSNLLIPDWLQVLGRSHPLLLHFPIVLILMGLLFFWIPNIKSDLKEVGTYCLLIGSNFAGITVIAGLILAQEDFEGTDLDWHQWMGIATFVLSVMLYFFREKQLTLLKPLTLGLGVIIVLTGHLGANLTHGSDFLLAPIQSQEIKQVQLSEAIIFTDMVQPILEAKCLSCHKEGKIKGELRLDHLAGIKKGGESGPFIVPGDAKESLLTQRIHLPKEEKKHMPPKNKEQLTDEELEILTAWVLNGADFEKKVVDLEPENDLFVFASAKFEKNKTYSFKAADPDLVAELNNFFRKINPLFPDSPALEVSYFGISAFDPESLKDLTKIKEQVVKINLNKMPLEGVDLSLFTNFPNLEEIQLNFAGITNSQIADLSKIKTLKSLAISGNKINDDVIPDLKKLTQLQKLYIWKTDLSKEGMKKIQAELKSVEIDFGFDETGLIYELNAPKIIYDEILFKDSVLLEIKHPIPSVDIRYTLDGTSPDSINSKSYSGPILLKNTSRIHTKAFAEGWIGSPEESILLFKSGILPSEIALLSEPNKKYAGNGARTLYDEVKSNSNHTTGDWLGYQEIAADFIVKLADSNKPKQIVFSLLYNESAYIFPPAQVEIWVKQSGTWNLAIKETPPQSEEIKIARLEALKYNLPAESFDEIRVRLTPLSRLPKWHPGAGEKGWVFIDEVLLED
ncbi:chitobiase/beta-hexosaminidase C-terminal domain-containing protein [Algoriphagus aestuarii]|nr:chitobiase/beta-hexosaminidase C-terminal domain-containing protein [Algoriphagus aestuarii]